MPRRHQARLNIRGVHASALGLRVAWSQEGGVTALAEARSFAPKLREKTMPKASHTEAAAHHEAAAKSHKAAADSHGKNDAAAATKHATEAHGHSTKAHESSTKAHAKSK